MSILINRTNEVDKVNTSKKGVLNVPNWSVIPTKNMQVPSDKELIWDFNEG